MKCLHTDRVATLCVLLLSTALLTACLSPGGSGQDPDPLVQDYGIAYVMRPVTTDANGDPVNAPDTRTMESHTPGGDLYYRDLASPSAPERNITGALTGGVGDVKDVEVSYDGTKLLFSMHLDEPDPNAEFIDAVKWDLYEYDIPTDRLRRITTANVSQEGDDVTPHYLPDGRIIFSSNRQRRFRAVLTDEGKGTGPFNALDENRNEHAMMLHVMDAGNFDPGGGNAHTFGGNIIQRSMNMSHDLDPVVRSNPLHDGKVMFTRWDNMGGRNQMSLYQSNPDGTQLQLLYGAHSHATGTNNATIQFLQPREMPDGRIMTIMKPFNGAQGGGDLVLIDTENYIDNTFATAVNAGILFGPAQTPATANVVTTDGSISPGGRFASAWPLDDGTNRLLVSWSSCRLLENNQIVPCTPARLAAPNPVPAEPIYGIFIYDMDNNTQIPIVAPQEGFAFTDVVAVKPRPKPNIIFDAQAGAGLDADAEAADAGILNIRSVYDLDGVDNVANLTADYTNITDIADPGNWASGPRPARFLRIVKGVGIPDNDTRMIPNTAYGASAQQAMREIVGYAPVQPDGSVRTYVPANVPLAISVVDANGRRISNRHQNWLQFRAGEEVTCNGCHDHASGTPHAHPGQPLTAYAGSSGSNWPNTRLRDVYGYHTMNPNDPAVVAINFQESMAETITGAIPETLLPTIDPLYDDYWTDIQPPSMLTQENRIQLDYPVSTPSPETAACAPWSSLCRSVIHYETHIHPLWSVSRGAMGADTCINCHAGASPAAELDLSDGQSPDEPAHFEAYRELLFTDSIPDPVDPMNNPPITIFPSMSPAGAMASNTFFSRFDAGGTHAGFLTPEELRLLAEWLDIGAQYYNDPSVVP